MLAHVTARTPPLRQLARAGRLPRRDQLMLAGADQFGAPHAPQRLAQHRPVVGVVIAQEGLVQAPDA
jgi:hypothetical protein